MTLKLEDFNVDNVLIHTKSFQNILIYDISYKTLIGPKLLHIISIKQMDLLEFMIGLEI